MHNQPLEVKFAELYTCWTYFVIERVLKHQGLGIFWNHMSCNALICLRRTRKWKIVLLDKIILVVCWTDAKRLVLNRLLHAYYIFVEENTKLWRASDTFSAIKKALRAQGISCKNLVRNLKIFKETCKNKAILTRSCKISARIMLSLARSCKASCKNFIFSQLGYLIFFMLGFFHF